MKGRRRGASLDPDLDVAYNYGLTARRLAEAMRIAQEHYDEIRAAWDTHFGGER